MRFLPHRFTPQREKLESRKRANEAFGKKKKQHLGASREGESGRSYTGRNETMGSMKVKRRESVRKGTKQLWVSQRIQIRQKESMGLTARII